ncbi:MAG: hypothetical protein A3C62_02680 [Candidatus Zambryskibacteria bacterium RIFCSPHIGHO2_02_FULL_39_16]|uniref:Twin-arginine translocation signal domain-containing protein n=1 Tax=Candidatus Zambryskibacteria bacterium RIFCSPLOWO2_02_FULL_39_14 TaxID=1802769 RepID=A0A1G2UIS0_9BACT|nr:MAG: hypothetical protein A3C62_02680 [Candidatus Zambryskibacteria bacterium RIFCSPHIGHO2_02_FULL_39_16]OHB09318.1 MAG: hypothetical protein A3I86_01175 [Candidatus Zambryskibacteria bacterium RIFCSPLOWO2_02_FULL_39_14]
MFLPNTDSFVLIRRPIVKTGFPVFLPNTESFLLIRRSTVKPEFAPTPVLEETGVGAESDSGQSEVNDQKRRNFLKVAGVAGAGIVASQLFSPKKASALIMGSSPTTGVIGVKDSTNARINPATEETVSTLATEATLDEVLKTSDLTFDAGSLQVKITSVSGEGSSSFSDSGDVARSALVDGDRHVQVDVLSSTLPSSASTETTLQTIAFGGTQFALRLATVSDVDYVGEASIGTATSAASWRIKKVDSASGIIIQWADGNASFDNIWDNRASLTYS